MSRRQTYTSPEPYYDSAALCRAYSEYAYTGVLEDPVTMTRFCPSCEQPEDFCDCGQCR